MSQKSYWKIGTTDRREPHSYIHLQKKDVAYVTIAGLLVGLVGWLTYKFTSKPKALPAPKEDGT